MKCLETERSIRYAYRLVDEPAAAEVRGHLEECPHCRQIVAQYIQLDAVLSEWKAAEPSPGFDARVRQAVEAEQARREGLRFLGWQWARGLAMASLGFMLVAGLVWFTHWHHRSASPSLAATRQPHPVDGAKNSVPPVKPLVRAEVAQAKVTPARHVPKIESASASLNDDNDAQAMEDYDMAANFDLLSEIPKGERRIAN